MAVKIQGGGKQPQKAAAGTGNVPMYFKSISMKGKFSYLLLCETVQKNCILQYGIYNTNSHWPRSKAGVPPVLTKVLECSMLLPAWVQPWVCNTIEQALFYASPVSYHRVSQHHFIRQGEGNKQLLQHHAVSLWVSNYNQEVTCRTSELGSPSYKVQWSNIPKFPLTSGRFTCH